MRLDPDVETAVYRLVQESLSNVGQHAHADRVAVDVAEHENDIAIVVRDDGKGFDPGPRPRASA